MMSQPLRLTHASKIGSVSEVRLKEETPREKRSSRSTGDVTPPISFQYHNIYGFKTLFVLVEFKFDFIALVKGLKSTFLNAGVVDKYVIPIFPSNEPVALLLVEPFNPSFSHCNSPPSTKNSQVSCNGFQVYHKVA